MCANDNKEHFCGVLLEKYIECLILINNPNKYISRDE